MLVPGVKVWASKNSWECETSRCTAVYTAHNVPSGALSSLCVCPWGIGLANGCRVLSLNTNPVQKPRRACLKLVPGKRTLKSQTGN